MLPLPPANPSDNSPQVPPQQQLTPPTGFPQGGASYAQPQTPPASSNRKLWIILGSVLGGGCLMTVCGIIAMIGVLSILGRRVETTFDQINSGLEQQESSLSAPKNQASVAPYSPLTYAFSPDVDMNMVTAAIESGTGSVQPKAGHEFMVVRFRLTGGDFADTIFASDVIEARTHLVDDQGHQYQCCATTFMEAKQYNHFTEQANGTDYNIAYEVPKSAKMLFLIYRDETGQDVTKVQVR